MDEQRKQPGESWESFADRRIREAQEEGQFDRLPGFGKPIPGINEPLDENWWVKDKLRRENINAVPPILEARLKIERTLEELPAMKSESEVRRKLQELNEFIRRAHYSHIPGPTDGVRPVDIEALIDQWRQTQSV